MKITLVCHGNIARSQVLHHYIAKCASEDGISLDVFSCGVAPWKAYPNAEGLLEEVRRELQRRGVEGRVARNVLDAAAVAELATSDVILAADRAVRDEVLKVLTREEDRERVSLFYEYIGEGTVDFVDTYDRDANAQDPARFGGCFDELERIAKKVVQAVKAGARPGLPN